MITDFRLTVFITVARTLSFTRAAEMLNVSQPAISKHIKELEGEVGEPLFVRGGNRIAMTDKATELVPAVHAILEGYRALNETITKDRSSFEGRLLIGASTTIAQYLLPSILVRFNKRYPNIILSVRSANSDAVIEMLQNKEIDLALIEDDHQNGAVCYRHLCYDKLVLVSSRQRKRGLEVEDLRSIPLLIREDGSGTLNVIVKALKRVGVSRKELNIKMQLGSSVAIVSCLRESGDYAFVSSRIAQELVDGGALNIVEVKGLTIDREFRFASLHGQGGRLVALFEAFCQQHCR